MATCRSSNGLHGLGAGGDYRLHGSKQSLSTITEVDQDHRTICILGTKNRCIAWIPLPLDVGDEMHIKSFTYSKPSETM